MEKRILSVLAHPDDESFGMGGTLAKYASEGSRVHLICATRGEAGEVAPEYLAGYDSIAELRIEELNCAIGKLGIETVHFLDYRDSGMTGNPANDHPAALINAPLDEVAGKIAAYIREYKPQVVLTFDPIGGYRHPDHIFIHEATTRAFSLAGDSNFDCGLPPYHPARLYYHTIPRHFIRFNVQLLKFLGRDPSKYGKNQDIDLTQLAIDDFPVHVRVPYRKQNKAKLAAAACHASQGGEGLTRGPMRWIAWLFGARLADGFMLGCPPPEDHPGPVRRDLFAGIRE